MVTRVLRSIEVKWDGSNVRVTEATVEIGDDGEETQVLAHRLIAAPAVATIAGNLVNAVQNVYAALGRPVTLPGA